MIQTSVTANKNPPQPYVKKYLFGRRPILTTVKEVTKGNVNEVLNKALVIHNQNKADIQYLVDYHSGKAPILGRTKEVRPEICNRIAENHAQEIVNFRVGYILSEPCSYVRRGNDDSVSDKINELNNYMYNADKSSADRELVDWGQVCGLSYRMVLPNEDGPDSDTPIEIDTPDPRNTFIIRNNGFGKKPIASVSIVVDDNSQPIYTVYTPTMCFKINGGKVSEESHTYGDIPIIEYRATLDMMGAFEPVLPLLDALNDAVSNRMDGIEQFIQHFVKFINCDIDEEGFSALKAMGAIKAKGQPGMPVDIGIVSQELDQSQSQVLVDYLYSQVLTIVGIPLTGSSRGAASDTGTAVYLRNGWEKAETNAKDYELMFKKPEKQFLRLVLRFLKTYKDLDLNVSDIDIKFPRRATDNTLVKAQSLVNMLQAGIHPSVAIASCGMFSDPADVYTQSIPYLEKWLPSMGDFVQSSEQPPQENESIEASLIQEATA